MSLSRTILGPVSLVVELAGIPNNFQHKLRDLDGMGRWAITAGAGSSESGGSVLGVGDVRLVVGAVEVLAVPATTRY